MHKDQGNVGEAAAILYFVQAGYKISKPLFENIPYDLIVDKDGVLCRVQVKSSSSKNKYGNYQIELRTKGGNKSWGGVVKLVDATGCDLLFVYCADSTKFIIPVGVFDGQGRLSLGKKYLEYRV